MVSNAGNAATRAIGQEIAALRDERGISARRLALDAGFHPSTVSRIEAGKTKASVAVLAALLARLNVVGDDRERLLARLGTADAPQWVETGSGLPTQLTALLRFERTASEITEVNPLLIPGLLQTPDYAEAVMRVSFVGEGNEEPLITVRMGRQRVLDRSVAIEAIIDESALMRPMGGAKVMSEQCAHLVRESKRSNITVRVLPISAVTSAVNGMFCLFSFAKEPPIVHLEHLRSGLFVDENDDVAVFVAAVDSLRSAAMSPQESVQLIATYRDRHRETEA